MTSPTLGDLLRAGRGLAQLLGDTPAPTLHRIPGGLLFRARGVILQLRQDGIVISRWDRPDDLLRMTLRHFGRTFGLDMAPATRADRPGDNRAAKRKVTTSAAPVQAVSSEQIVETALEKGNSLIGGADEPDDDTFGFEP